MSFHKWHHLAVVFDGTNATLYIDGSQKNQTTIAVSGGVPNISAVARIGYQVSGNEFQGYMDGFRIQKGIATYTSNFTPPTKIYGAMFPANPSVGTITITGATTDSTDIAFTEINNSLPNGLTLNDQGAGNQTATITGTLTDVVSSDTTTNNIRIQAKANNDANRITEVNESSGVGAVSITKKAGGAPVLFNARRYIGNATARDINGFGFQPDLIWVKNRDIGVTSHSLTDSVRGTAGGTLNSDDNIAQDNTVRIDSFNPDGYGIKVGNWGYNNKTDEAFIAWAWKAGGAPVSITGTNLTNITQSASSASGFSITKYTGGATTGMKFPHNLGGTPDLVIIKRITDGTRSWVVWHSGLTGATSTGDSAPSIYLDLTNAQDTAHSGERQYGYIDPPTSTEIRLTKHSSGTNYHSVGHTSTEYICYAWKAVSGVSAFGSYTGATGGVTSTNNIGFKPRFVIIKRTNVAQSWIMLDTFRQATDTDLDNYLLAEDAGAEGGGSWSTGGINLVTNGFEIPSSSDSTAINNNGDTYIYMAFA